MRFLPYRHKPVDVEAYCVTESDVRGATKIPDTRTPTPMDAFYIYAPNPFRDPPKRADGRLCALFKSSSGGGCWEVWPGAWLVRKPDGKIIRFSAEQFADEFEARPFDRGQI